MNNKPTIILMMAFRSLRIATMIGVICFTSKYALMFSIAGVSQLVLLLIVLLIMAVADIYRVGYKLFRIEQ